ncbi:MAG: hypothetical protein AAFY71_07935 [Bacteroidota bacterium]
MKQLISLLFLIVLLCLSACRDRSIPILDDTTCQEECFIFEGQVMDPNNDVPVQSLIKVEFKRHPYLSFRVVGELETDSLGQYRFALNGRDFLFPNGEFKLQAFKEGFLTNSYDGTLEFHHPDSSQFDIPFAADLLLRPSANLQFTFKGELEGISDFRYRYRYGSTGFVFRVLDEHLDVAQVFEHEVAGDQFIQLSFNYMKAGQKVEKTDSLFIAKGELGVYKLEW